MYASSPQPLAGPTAVPAGVGQLTSSGSRDATALEPLLQAAGEVRDLLVQPDSKLLVAGAFT